MCLQCAAHTWFLSVSKTVLLERVQLVKTSTKDQSAPYLQVQLGNVSVLSPPCVTANLRVHGVRVNYLTRISAKLAIRHT